MTWHCKDSKEEILQKFYREVAHFEVSNLYLSLSYSDEWNLDLDWNSTPSYGFDFSFNLTQMQKDRFKLINNILSGTAYYPSKMVKYYF